MEVMDMFIHLDCDDGFMGACVCSNLPNCVLNMDGFSSLSYTSIKLLKKKKPTKQNTKKHLEPME